MTNACMGIAARLSAQDHQVWTGTLRDISKVLKVNGMRQFEMPSVSLNVKELKSAIQQNNASTRMTNEELYTAYHDQFDFSRYQAMLASYEIDLILIDVELHEYICFSSTLEIPMLLVSQWFSGWQSQSNPPLDSKRLPKSTLGNQLQWWKHKTVRYLKSKVKQVTTSGANRRSFLLRMMGDYHFDQRQLQSYRFPLPFNYKDLPVISTTHPDLELDRQSRSDLTYSYPMVHHSRKEEVSVEFQTAFTQVLSKKTHSNQKLIIVTYTTMDNDSTNIENLLNVLSGLEDCISVVSLGGAYEDYQSYQSARLYLFKSIPQLMALKEADLSINHGGIHTINECIHFSVPMLILSGGMYDQNGCALRVQEFGCGIAHFGSQIPEDNLRRSIVELLTNNTYQQQMRVLHESYQLALEAMTLESYIDDYLMRK